MLQMRKVNSPTKSTQTNIHNQVSRGISKRGKVTVIREWESFPTLVEYLDRSLRLVGDSFYEEQFCMVDTTFLHKLYEELCEVRDGKPNSLLYLNKNYDKDFVVVLETLLKTMDFEEYAIQFYLMESGRDLSC